MDQYHVAMPLEEKLTVEIAGRAYPLIIEKSERKGILAMVSEYNKKLESLQVQYPKQDKQDCLAMVLLTMSNELYEARKLKQKIDDLPGDLEAIEQQIDDHLE